MESFIIVNSGGNTNVEDLPTLPAPIPKSRKPSTSVPRNYYTTIDDVISSQQHEDTDDALQVFSCGFNNPQLLPNDRDSMCSPSRGIFRPKTPGTEWITPLEDPSDGSSPGYYSVSASLDRLARKQQQEIHLRSHFRANTNEIGRLVQPLSGDFESGVPHRYGTSAQGYRPNSQSIIPNTVNIGFDSAVAASRPRSTRSHGRRRPQTSNNGKDIMGDGSIALFGSGSGGDGGRRARSQTADASLMNSAVHSSSTRVTFDLEVLPEHKQSEPTTSDFINGVDSVSSSIYSSQVRMLSSRGSQLEPVYGSQDTNRPDLQFSRDGRLVSTTGTQGAGSIGASLIHVADNNHSASSQQQVSTEEPGTQSTIASQGAAEAGSQKVASLANSQQSISKGTQSAAASQVVTEGGSQQQIKVAPLANSQQSNSKGTLSASQVVEKVESQQQIKVAPLTASNSKINASSLAVNNSPANNTNLASLLPQSSSNSTMTAKSTDSQPSSNVLPPNPKDSTVLPLKPADPVDAKDIQPKKQESPKSSGNDISGSNNSRPKFSLEEASRMHMENLISSEQEKKSKSHSSSHKSIEKVKSLNSNEFNPLMITNEVIEKGMKQPVNKSLASSSSTLISARDKKETQNLSSPNVSPSNSSDKSESQKAISVHNPESQKTSKSSINHVPKSNESIQQPAWIPSHPTDPSKPAFLQEKPRSTEFQANTNGKTSSSSVKTSQETMQTAQKSATQLNQVIPAAKKSGTQLNQVISADHVSFVKSNTQLADQQAKQEHELDIALNTGSKVISSNKPSNQPADSMQKQTKPVVIRTAPLKFMNIDKPILNVLGVIFETEEYRWNDYIYRLWKFYQYLKDSKDTLPPDSRKELGRYLHIQSPPKSQKDLIKSISIEMNLLSRYEYCRQKVSWNFLRTLVRQFPAEKQQLIGRNVAMIFADRLIGCLNDEVYVQREELQSMDELSQWIGDEGEMPLHLGETIAYQVMLNYGSEIFEAPVSTQATSPKDLQLVVRSLKDCL